VRCHSSRNITERKKTKLKIQEKEQMLAKSQELALIGCWSLDVATGLLSWSEETYIMLGVTKKTFIHTMEAFYELIHSDDHDKVVLWFEDCLAGNSMQELDYRISLADGTDRTIRATGGLQWDDMKQPLRIAGCMQDITGRIHKDQKDQVHRQQLAHVTHLGLVSEMASVIAHELNQPLSAISIFTEVGLSLLQKNNSDLVKLSEILVKTQQLALKAGEVTARMRDFINPQTEPYTSTDLNTLIQNAVDLCITDIKKHSIQLTLGLADNLPTIHVDPIQIEQVLINLINNSIDALRNLPTTLKRQLSIQTQLILNHDVEVRVKDNGLGIDHEHQAKILTPFYSTKSMGMGMGLPICRAFIEAHAGQLHFNSQPGKGATFYFSLPSQTRAEMQEKTVFSAHQYSEDFNTLEINLPHGQFNDQTDS
jgi:signal transduction histidine kinase